MTDLLTHRTADATDAAASVVDVSTDADVPACALQGSVTHALAVAVAPSMGRFRPEVDAGAHVKLGELLGYITGGGGRADAVYAPTEGVVEAHLARMGQLVKRGRGLVWLSGRSAVAV